MKDDITIGEITKTVENVSNEFELNNTDLKRKYLIWCIEVFKSIASRVSVAKGAFGTGYPFYALDKDLKGTLPVITEQIIYNRQLVRDGIPVQKSIWKCKSCLDKNYSQMPNLKTICKPCPNVINELKPRKIINRLPDIDMWLVCKDGMINIAQKELTEFFEQNNISTSDINPIRSIEDIIDISKQLKSGQMPEIHLPIDAHIIEYSKLKELIYKVPEILREAKKHGIPPYLPIHPKSYRKQWQYDDEAYNYICDFLASFTEFEFDESLQMVLDETRRQVAKEHIPDELFELLLQSSKPANSRRFQTPELKENFKKRVSGWKIQKKDQNNIPR